ncbi:hypothetical protein [Botryobacter ruber]|uniref:hypothetical protein n=1 Tax=Botryobacter ruber TaxID=2171629 RepID=UPI000E0A5C72|nr:hypothetical protein [Botryobacter ruber]
MEDKILANMDNPRQLEKLYRDNRQHFEKAFTGIYPELKHNPLAEFWHERLHYLHDEISWGTGKDLAFVAVAALLAGILAKIPAFVPISEEFYYQRNIGFIVFPFLVAFFAWKNNLQAKNIALLGGAMLLGLIFINALPATESDTLLLSCIHLPLFLWSVLGVAFVGNAPGNYDRRLAYLRYNGDLLVMTALLGIAGFILTGATIGLFSLIGLQIEEFYGEYIIAFALPSLPILGTYLTQTNPQLVNKVSPVIAKLFGPLVLVMLVIYLIAIIYSGKDPYNDREFLLLFNGLLVGVMAIILFSVAESARSANNRLSTLVLFLLSAVTIVVNGIALSAIVFRIAEWGITPNRAAVLGSNLLILLNLLLVSVNLYKVLTKKTALADVEKPIAAFLPLYSIWIMVVLFLFPLLFGFK